MTASYLDRERGDQYTSLMRLIVRTIIAIILCSFSATSVFAKKQGNIVTPGFYLGVENGISDVDYKTHFAPGFNATSVDTSGFATRIVGGFDITKYVGALFSVIYFHKPEFHHINGGPLGSKIKNNLIFVAAQGMLPLSRRFVIYVDGGFGYIARSQVIVDRIALRNREIIRPVYGAGMAYLVWKRWALTLTWIQAPQDTGENLPTSNYIGGGIRYKFAT